MFQSLAQQCFEPPRTGRDSRKTAWREKRKAQETAIPKTADKSLEDGA